MKMGPNLCIEEDEGWTKISTGPCSDSLASRPTGANGSSVSEEPESIQDRIVRVSEDLKEIQKFYNIEGSPTRYARITDFLNSELDALSDVPFDTYDSQDDRVDHLLLRNFLSRAQRNLELESAREAEFAPFVEPFAGPLREWCEIRQRQRTDEVFEPQALAHSLSASRDAVSRAADHVAKHAGDYSQAAGSRAARRIAELRAHIDETCAFYSGYHPSFDYWVAAPRDALDTALHDLEKRVRDLIIGNGDNNDDAIVGEPIGRDGLLVELEAEMIPYTPEALLEIAEREYTWCEAEMQKASQQLGHASNWRAALEHVKNLYAPPATHTSFVRELVAEGATYVQHHALVTVPRLAAEAIVITRIPPARQRVSPFFLGGRRLQIAYPRADMGDEAKRMALRGNNRHFSRATAFHEMIPGHRLQGYVGARSARAYRARLFDTPFFVEGWALYWEMLLWRRGDFFETPEDKVGALFWRMHRCVRITFSLGFHLGRLSAAECVELLVGRVGHERATAEGEVRRSLDGSYSPLYQAGYMLGALQIMQLRREAVEGAVDDGDDDDGANLKFVGKEKEFHDSILKANVMPIEMLRALLLGKKLDSDFKSTWKFYGDI